MSAETELAWAAGFFDGEGWSSPANVKWDTKAGPKSKNYMQIGAGQKHDEPLLRMQSATGEGRIFGPDASGMYRWKVYGLEQCDRVMAALWPYLGSVKREQYERALVIEKE